MSPEPIFKTTNLVKTFGKLAAVNNANVEIYEGEIVGLIGPNGAGKTTFFNVVTGLYKPDSGKVFFKGVDISGFYPHAICRLGVCRTFQVVKSFANMTVEDAVRVGAYHKYGEKDVMGKVDEVVAFCDLEGVRKQKCAQLGLSPLKRVELARALATEPTLLLLDEAGGGLNPTEMAELMAMLRRLNEQKGITLCVVEHVMQMVMGLCARIVVMDYGEIIAEGCPEAICSNEMVIEAYLGKRAGR
jgi:branched-chain amino acid transport system ATP-binding protein